MMGLLLAIGMLVDNAVVVVESIYQERERMPGKPRLASILGTRHVAIALSAGTLCHCIVFVPNLFGARNMLSIYMGQIAITICVSLLASCLVRSEARRVGYKCVSTCGSRRSPHD